MAMTGGTARLVHTGYGGGASNFPIKLYVYYKTSQSTAANQSTITCGMYVVTNSGWDIGAWTDSRGSYVGTESNTFDGSIPNFSGTRWLVENKTFTVTHKDDGTGTATIKWKWGVNSPWGGFENKSGSFSIDLPTIARASIPTADPTAVRMGATVTIKTNRKSTSFTHTLKYTFGGTTATFATGVGDSYPWKIPDLAAKCNNATSGTCTITCETYNGGTKVGTNTCSITLSVPLATTPTLPNGDVILGSGNPVSAVLNSTNFKVTMTYSFGSLKNQPINNEWWATYDLAKQIKDKPSGTGEISCSTWNGNALVGTKTIPFTAVVPDNSITKPKIDAFTLTPTGNLASAFSGLYIQGKTGVKAAFTASSVYSTVASYKLTADGKVYTGNPATSAVIARSGNLDIIGTVTDARGFSNTTTKTITVHEYSQPTLKNIVCYRSTGGKEKADDGLYLYIKATRSYYPLVVDGTQRNHCTIKCRVTPEGGSASEYILLPAATTSTDTYDAIVPNVKLFTEKSYDVQVIVQDEISAENAYSYPIPTADVTMHLGFGGYGVAFGKYSEATSDDKRVEIADDWSLMMGGEKVADFVVEQGVTNSWRYRKWSSGIAECWCERNVTVSINSSWGALYYGATPTYDYPLTFAAIPTCVIDVAYGNDSSPVLMLSGGRGTETTARSVMLCRTTTGTVNCTLIYHAKGRWK